MEKESVIPKSSPMKLDVMVGSCWSGQVSFTCTPGVEYTIDELKAFARMKKPLAGKQGFRYPTNRPAGVQMTL